MNRLQTWLREWRGTLLLLLGIFAFRSVVADMNQVPSGSMLPTLQIGDRMLVDRAAYDLRIPFTHVSLMRLGEPSRGDVVVFDSQATGERMVKRVVSLPGDVVAMRNNALTINGKPLSYKVEASDGAGLIATEALATRTHELRIQPWHPSDRASFGPVRLPPDQYLMLGDNRDNSLDSRYIGLVPRKELLGRATRVLVSLDPEHYWLPRGDRWLARVN